MYLTRSIPSFSMSDSSASSHSLVSMGSSSWYIKPSPFASKNAAGASRGIRACGNNKNCDNDSFFYECSAGRLTGQGYKLYSSSIEQLFHFYCLPPIRMANLQHELDQPPGQEPKFRSLFTTQNSKSTLENVMSCGKQQNYFD